ncbi:ABC transporter substrate-binding protein [Salinicoccus roseus]|uniref:ABC transporter substrate-binding protein n=1 Tax=Salinicoccus roseus TaxID=45670 RepID=A0A0C2HMN7_9STAP|nr:ABC transporter substrate-binding protein [Salinicoccus roseus]KIH70796.1 ABC transporter substrate-binding protein [Salinicoccus roseus]MDB0580436.1 ABC transporter substrate-binding protein [Salinicoccus roseus]
MKKFLFLILTAVFILGACGGFQIGDSESSNSSEEDSASGETEGNGAEGSNGEKVTLDFWSFWGSEQRRPVIDKIIEDFNSSQDEIEVQHTYVPWGDIWTKNLAAIAAGDPPDIIINDINTVKLRAQEGQMEPITEFVDSDVEDRFYDQMTEAAMYDDEMYALPFNTDTQILFYNKDLFEEAGLDPEDPPSTWAEAEEYAAQLDVEEGGSYERIGFYPLIGSGTDVWMMNALGENYISPDGDVKIDTEPVHDTFNWILEQKNKYGENTITSINSQFENAQQDPFMAGNIGMMVQNANYYVQLRDFGQDMNFGVAPLPEKEEGNGHTSWGGGFVAEIPKGAKNPEASYKFIEFLTSHDSQLYWAENNFDLVAHEEAGSSAAESDEFSEAGQEVYSLMVENMDNTLLTPQPLVAPDFASTVNPTFESIISGNTTVEAGLEKAQSDLERIVENNR